LDEAGVLAEMNITSLELMRLAARKLQARFGAAILLKGGHLKGCREATDVFFDGRTELLLAAPFVRGITTHGTGCTYSAAVCAGLAEGKRLVQAVKTAKDYITQVIAGSRPVGNSFVLGHLAKSDQRLGRRRR
jgi:hydroxymethylpyrimidine/phosphomethylpyrimidine kinase